MAAFQTLQSALNIPQLPNQPQIMPPQATGASGVDYPSGFYPPQAGFEPPTMGGDWARVPDKPYFYSKSLNKWYSPNLGGSEGGPSQDTPWGIPNGDAGAWYPNMPNAPYQAAPQGFDWNKLMGITNNLDQLGSQGSQFLNPVKSGSGIPTGMGRYSDTEPATAYQAFPKTEGNFWSDVLHNFVTGPGIPLAGFLGAGLAAGSLGSLFGGAGAGAGIGEEMAGLGGFTGATPIAPTGLGGLSGLAPTFPDFPIDPGLTPGTVPMNPSIPDFPVDPSAGTPTMPTPPTGPQFPNMPPTPPMPPADTSGTNPNMTETGTPNWNPTNPGMGATAATALSTLSQLTGLDAGMLKLLGITASTALGILGSQQQTQALKNLASQFSNVGAPYRDQLLALTQNPNSFFSSTEATATMDAILRRLSPGGNPAGDPYKQALAIGALYDKLQGKENQLANFGGLGNFNAAAPGALTNAVGSNTNIYNALGAGLNQMTSPQQTDAQMYQRLAQIFGGEKIWGL